MNRPFAPGHEIPPELLLRAYASGVFPMAENADDPEVFWVKPETRGIIPLDQFHVPKSMIKSMRKRQFEIAFDRDFDAVISACAQKWDGRTSTWINAPIRHAYAELFKRGNCHTVEAWRDGELVGGLYGVTLGAAFFGESMFARETDASKTCLVHLVARLIERGFQLLDTQFITDHLKRFGAEEIPRRHYEGLLESAIRQQARFYP